MVKEKTELSQKKRNARNHRLKKGIIIAVVAIVLGGIAWTKFSGNKESPEAEALYTVKKGSLRISVEESGKIKAKNSVSISCEVEGQSTIISIVPEGTYVKEGDSLVELDSSDLRDRIEQQEITVESAEAAYTQANEAYEIQENQNESDIKAAQLALDFARIDLEKYIGREWNQPPGGGVSGEGATGSDATRGDLEVAEMALDFANKLLAEYTRESSAKNPVEGEGADGNPTKNNQEGNSAKALSPSLDIAVSELEKRGGGDWHQQLRNAIYQIVEADSKLKLEKNQVEGTRELFSKGYVPKTQLDAHETSYQNSVIALKKAIEAMRLLIKYDHPKQFAKFAADYEEAAKKLDRVKRTANSQSAQRQADRNAKKAMYDMQKARLEKLKSQLEKTTIKAPQQGLVVYASSTSEPWRRERGLVAEGEKVYERQKLIELPDLSAMKVDVNIHESVRDIIKEDQPAIISVEAVPGVVLRGHVEKIALLPDSGRQWMNPDLTVYPTSVIIDGRSDALKPGMTAKVEIIVADLENAMYVPVQAVTVRGDREVCYVAKGSSFVETAVEVGLSNDNYVEIRSGLNPGDKVRTYAPVTVEERAPERKPPKVEPEKEVVPKPVGTAEAPKIEEGAAEMPADAKERAKAFLENLTPEQKKQMEQRLKEAGVEGEIDLEKMTPERMREIGRRMMERRGRTMPPGEGPREGPEGPRVRPEGRPPFQRGGSPRGGGEPRPGVPATP